MGYITIYDEVYKARRPGFQNVKKQCEFKHLKEATVNWLPYLVFQACFMTSNSKICSSSAKTIVVSELKSTLRNNKFSWSCYIIYITFLVKLRFLYREHTCLFYISISTQHSTQCLFCCIKTCPVWLKGMSLCRHSTCTANIIRCPIRFQLSSDIYIYISACEIRDNTAFHSNGVADITAIAYFHIPIADNYPASWYKKLEYSAVNISTEGGFLKKR